MTVTDNLKLPPRSNGGAYLAPAEGLGVRRAGGNRIDVWYALAVHTACKGAIQVWTHKVIGPKSISCRDVLGESPNIAHNQSSI